MVMGCDELKDLLALYAGGEVSDNERIAVDAHLSGCAACARELAEFRDVRGMLGGLRDGEPPPGRLEAIWPAVAAGIAPVRPSRASWFDWGVRAAAVLVIGVALGHSASQLAGRRPEAPLTRDGSGSVGGPAMSAGSDPAPGPGPGPGVGFTREFPVLRAPSGSDRGHHLPRVERILSSEESDF